MGAVTLVGAWCGLTNDLPNDDGTPGNLRASSPAVLGMAPEVVPLEAGGLVKPPPATNVGSSTVNGISVTTMADATIRSLTGAITRYSYEPGRAPSYVLKWADKEETKKVIGTLNGAVPVLKVTIQTFYGPGVTRTDISLYGRGTTAGDKGNGNVTLGFHESCHRQDFLDFIASNVPPKFGGKVGMTEEEYRDAGPEYEAACKKYKADAMAYSKTKTDSVGDPPPAEHMQDDDD